MNNSPKPSADSAYVTQRRGEGAFAAPLANSSVAVERATGGSTAHTAPPARGRKRGPERPADVLYDSPRSQAMDTTGACLERVTGAQEALRPQLKLEAALRHRACAHDRHRFLAGINQDELERASRHVRGNSRAN